MIEDTLNRENLIKREIDFNIELMTDLIYIANNLDEVQRIKIGNRWLSIHSRYLDRMFEEVIEDYNEYIKELKEKLNNL